MTVVTLRRHPADLDRLATDFDELYTRMTAVQRALLAGQRHGSAVTEHTITEARAMLAAFTAASRAAASGEPAPRDTEAAALAARVLQTPVDGTLLMAAVAAQGRSHGYTLLAAALRRARDDGTITQTFETRTVVDVLSAPRSMSVTTARRLAGVWRVQPDARIADLDTAAYERMAAGAADAAAGLPDGVETWRRKGPQARPDGRGEAATVLNSWIKASGPATDSPRSAAIAAARRDGWPTDAGPCAEVLVAFTTHRLMPLVIDDWERLAAIEDPDEHLQALRDERNRYHAWHDSDGDSEKRWLLAELVDAVASLRKAQRLAATPPDDWGAGSPLSSARTAARRCGTILSVFYPDIVEPLISKLPAEESFAG